MTPIELVNTLIPASFVGKGFIIDAEEDSGEVDEAMRSLGFIRTKDHVLIVYRIESIFSAYAVHLPTMCIDCSVTTHTKHH